MNDKAVELLQALAAKLGTTVEYLWPLLVAKTRFDYIAQGVALVLGALLSGLAFRFLKRKFEAAGEDYIDSDLTVPLGIVGVAMLICTVALVFHVGAMGTLFYPEAAVIQNLMGRAT